MFVPTNPRCGECHACCIHLDIDDPKKPAHQWCPHLSRHGCDVYATRSRTCSSFFCVWLAEANAPARMRPDRSGVLMHLTTNEIGGLGLEVIECRPGAIDDSAEYLEPKIRRARATLVVTRYRDGQTRSYSRCPQWIADFCARNPKLPLPPPSKIKSIEIKETNDGGLGLRIEVEVDDEAEG